VYGYGDFSEITTIRASNVPHTMDSVETLNAFSTIVISWQAPNNGGEDIDLYDLELLMPNNSTLFVNDPTCLGAPT
jgi:hypothetical protein